MAFRKTANVEVLGIKDQHGWSKLGNARFSSVYMDDGYGINIEEVLDTVADAYKISRDPNDYLLIPCRAVSADRPNENMDGFRRNELLRFDPRVGRRVYSTFLMKPHFVNHNAVNYRLARGVLIDSHYNDQNSASDNIKEAVFEATGSDVVNDEFTEVLIAADTTKDKHLAEAYKNGSVYKFSMGCDVDSTECSICGKTAYTTLQFCEHVVSKLAGRPYPINEGKHHRKAFEWCNGTIFAELSAVDDPADKDAEIQEGILQVATHNLHRGSNLTDGEICEIASFVARNAKTIPESVAKLINSVFLEG